VLGIVLLSVNHSTALYCIHLNMSPSGDMATEVGM
jgi:hypothetical protein